MVVIGRTLAVTWPREKERIFQMDQTSNAKQVAAQVDRVVMRKRRRWDATIRATWPDGVVMMFGTSYRTWWDQLSEYLRMTKRPKPTIEVSPEPWIGYGGLKWCPWEEFQEQLDIEPYGRTVEAFEFRDPTAIELNCLKSA